MPELTTSLENRLSLYLEELNLKVNILNDNDQKTFNDKKLLQQLSDSIKWLKDCNVKNQSVSSSYPADIIKFKIAIIEDLLKYWAGDVQKMEPWLSNYPHKSEDNEIFWEHDMLPNTIIAITAITIVSTIITLSILITPLCLMLIVPALLCIMLPIAGIANCLRDGYSERENTTQSVKMQNIKSNTAEIIDTLQKDLDNSSYAPRFFSADNSSPINATLIIEATAPMKEDLTFAI